MTYEYSEQMKANRDQWGGIGVSHTSVLIPEKYKLYFKAILCILCGKELMAAIEAHDEVTLNSFANRTPRLAFDEADVLAYMNESDNAEVQTDCDEILSAMIERKKYIQSAKKAAAEGDELKAQYWFCRDYALCFLIRGSFMLMQAKAKGGVPDMKEFR